MNWSALTQEQMENPALEVSDQRICLFCGTLVQGQACANCGHFAQQSPSAFSTSEISLGEEIPAEIQWDNYYHYDSSDDGSIVSRATANKYGCFPTVVSEAV